MAASRLQLSDSENWRAQPQSGADAPDPELTAWLRWDGLLTRRLRERCGAAFNMQVLRNDACATTAALHREVLLCCNDRPCIYAITAVPAATLAAHDWLADLGDEPLGETLQGRADVSRSAFSYTLLQPQALPAQAAATEPVWARRSEFRIGDTGLTVTEVFLAALRDCAQA